MSYRTIQAGELAAYLFCRRAWWLRRAVGPPASSHGLAAGIRYHRQQSRTILVVGWAQKLALILIFLAIALLAFWLVRTL